MVPHIMNMRAWVQIYLSVGKFSMPSLTSGALSCISLGVYTRRAAHPGRLMICRDMFLHREYEKGSEMKPREILSKGNSMDELEFDE